nr:reverse transcriptase domain-containing protein [Tanacetum cinerariifolium]
MSMTYPITASAFTTRSHPGTPHIHRASTSAHSQPVISPAFVKANFETIESLMRDYKRKARNEEVQRESKYFSEPGFVGNMPSIKQGRNHPPN